MAYSMGATPVPPPPLTTQQFSSAYRLSKDSRNNVAQNGVAPVNQMTNGFGGRTNADPNVSSGTQIAARKAAGAASGGNRTSQHVATPGNNNVSYRGTGLNTAQSLWQQAAKGNQPAPVNGMSLGFMKNTQAWGAPVAPPPPVATTQPATTAPPLTTQQNQQIADLEKLESFGNVASGVQAAPASGTPAPLTIAQQAEMLRQKVASSGGLKTGSYLPGPTGGTQQITGLKQYGNVWVPLVGTGANQQVHWAYRSLIS